MLLSDRTIVKLLEAGEIKMVPAPEDKQVQPVSVDLRLGNSFCRLRRHAPDYRWIDDQLLVRPGDFLLACTKERITLPAHIAGFVHGKSSWARRGLVVECAGLVDPGFDGTITLELANLGDHPVSLSAGAPICQISFQATDVAVVRPYGSAGLGSRYQGQTRAEPARG